MKIDPFYVLFLATTFSCLMVTSIVIHELGHAFLSLMTGQGFGIWFDLSWHVIGAHTWFYLGEDMVQFIPLAFHLGWVFQSAFFVLFLVLSRGSKETNGIFVFSLLGLLWSLTYGLTEGFGVGLSHNLLILLGLSEGVLVGLAFLWRKMRA
jgi:hypothetical protein